jgi:hypothetical protein
LTGQSPAVEHELRDTLPPGSKELVVSESLHDEQYRGVGCDREFPVVMDNLELQVGYLGIRQRRICPSLTVDEAPAFQTFGQNDPWDEPKRFVSVA